MKFFEAEEYQPIALSIFEDLKSSLLGVLPWAKIEHIGSSAIIGAVSKGDLDIFVGVSIDKLNISLTHLKSLGFYIKEDTLRTESLCMLESSNYKIDVAIQLVELGSSFENFLEFRDILNSRPELVTKYNKIKKSSKGLEPHKYREEKSKFISEVLDR